MTKTMGLFAWPFNYAGVYQTYFYGFIERVSMVHLARSFQNIRLIVILSCHSESVYDGSFLRNFI